MLFLLALKFIHIYVILKLHAYNLQKKLTTILLHSNFRANIVSKPAS